MVKLLPSVQTRSSSTEKLSWPMPFKRMPSVVLRLQLPKRLLPWPKPRPRVSCALFVRCASEGSDRCARSKKQKLKQEPQQPSPLRRVRSASSSKVMRKTMRDSPSLRSTLLMIRMTSSSLGSLLTSLASSSPRWRERPRSSSSLMYTWHWVTPLWSQVLCPVLLCFAH